MTDEGDTVEGEVEMVIVLSQQSDNGGPPAGFRIFQFEVNGFPDARPGAQATPGDGQMKMGIPVEFAPVGMQGTEDTDIEVFALCPAEQDVSRTGG